MRLGTHEPNLTPDLLPVAIGTCIRRWRREKWLWDVRARVRLRARFSARLRVRVEVRVVVRAVHGLSCLVLCAVSPPPLRYWINR